jgi:Mannose-1-phosphate guanylyltransferase
MAGGVGSRFWPMSRNSRPKQFLDVLGIGKTFIQSTFDRFAKVVPAENILVVTSLQYRELVKEQLPQMKDENILLEPHKRNTAPCIAYATYKLYKKNPDATVVVTPSDHLITDESVFEETIRSGLEEAALTDGLYTIGVTPTSPNTNYGYIQVNKGNKVEFNGHDVFPVKTFTEKPDLETAKIFLETGEFFWNSGMFIWSLKSIKRELELCLPEISKLFAGGEPFYYTDEEEKFIADAYEDCQSISIDYGVMEKTQNAWVAIAKFGWSDVGTWSSIFELSPSRDENDNIIKEATVMLDGVEKSVIKGYDKDKLIVLRGLKNYMVVDTKDVLMICPKDDKVVKQIVSDLVVKEKSKYL